MTTINGEGVDINRSVAKYVAKTIDSLDAYLPKPVRTSMNAAVVLRRIDQPHGNKYEAEVRLTWKGGSASASDTTLNPLAALDIVRAKLRAQLEE